VGGRNLPIPIDLAIRLYNSLYYRTSCDIGRGRPFPPEILAPSDLPPPEGNEF